MIGIMSDSHDNIPAIRQAVEFFNRQAVAFVVHAGDIVAPFSAKELLNLRMPLIVVFGNNDGEKNGLRKILPQIIEPPLATTVDGLNVFITHHLSDTQAAMPSDVQVVMHGHTHACDVRRKGHVLFVNPGETCGWLTGHRTVALLDPQQMECRILNLEAPQ